MDEMSASGGKGSRAEGGNCEVEEEEGERDEDAIEEGIILLPWRRSSDVPADVRRSKRFLWIFSLSS